ncbi:TetR-like C-terminal domain-containing protein [Rhizobium sullae]|uniref:TetR-like C-terminal domain-containing protein n=1 Tax=Rhizobium sullae TaxID=50338 RepID=UPI001A9E4B38
MDALLDDIQPQIADRHGATLAETFRNGLSDFARALDPPRRDLLRHLVGAAQSDPDLAQAFWENWISPRREERHRAIQAAVSLGRRAAACSICSPAPSITGCLSHMPKSTMLGLTRCCRRFRAGEKAGDLAIGTGPAVSGPFYKHLHDGGNKSIAP